jgi:hypothetical protein
MRLLTCCLWLAEVEAGQAGEEPPPAKQPPAEEGTRQNFDILDLDTGECSVASRPRTVLLIETYWTIRNILETCSHTIQVINSILYILNCLLYAQRLMHTLLIVGDFTGDWAHPEDDAPLSPHLPQDTKELGLSPGGGYGGPPGDSDGDEGDDDAMEELMDGEEEEEESEEENEITVLDPDHHLMKRFQKALKAHLMKQEEKVELELRELVILLST